MSWLKTGVFGLTGLALTACVGGPSLYGVTKADLNEAACQRANVLDNDQELTPKFLLEIAKHPGSINDFLDCVLFDFEPGNKVRWNGKAAELQKLQLYRGHVMVALLTRYGAFNITGQVGDTFQINFRSYSRAPQDASSLLTKIETAERELRALNTVNAQQFPAASSQGIVRSTKNPRAQRLHRVLSVVKVAESAFRPTIRRARGFFTNLALAFGGSSPSGLAALKGELNGIKKLAVLEQFGRAYFFDARQDLSNILKGTLDGTRPLLSSDWEGWDTLIDEACIGIGAVASATPHCTPA